MELKPHISLSSGRVNKQRQAMNRIHNNCAIVLYELRDALGEKMSRRKKRVAGDTQTRSEAATSTAATIVFLPK